MLPNQIVSSADRLAQNYLSNQGQGTKDQTVFEKLQTDYQRFLEIERLLLDPEVTADIARVTALSKERGTLAKIALPYGR